MLVLIVTVPEHMRGRVQRALELMDHTYIEEQGYSLGSTAWSFCVVNSERRADYERFRDKLRDKLGGYTGWLDVRPTTTGNMP